MPYEPAVGSENHQKVTTSIRKGRACVRGGAGSDEAPALSGATLTQTVQEDLQFLPQMKGYVFASAIAMRQVTTDCEVLRLPAA